MIVPTNEYVKGNREKASRLMAKTDLLLRNPSKYGEAISLLSQEDSKELAVHDQRIYMLYIISQIVSTEIDNNIPNVLFNGRNCDQLIRLYRILTLYLRRIEFNLPSDLSSEINSYIRSENISIIAVLGVLQNNFSILDKDKVCVDLVPILGGIR